MKKGNIIDLVTYRNCDSTKESNSANKKTISQELEAAIKLLIHQLRELGPLSRT